MAEQAPLSRHPLYDRAKQLVGKELEAVKDEAEVDTDSVRANVIATLKTEYPDLEEKIVDEGMLAQDISDEMHRVRYQLGLNKDMDDTKKSLGL